MSVSERIAALTPEQRELFELRRRRLSPAKPRGDEAIPRREPGAVYPLSFDQERLWFLYYLDPQATAYNIDTTTRMEGQLDVPALVRGLAEVVRRHEAWRTTFPEVDGRPVQWIADELPPGLRIVDLSGLDPARREEESPAVLRAEARRPFDLARGPLVRALLTRLGEADWLCTMTVHHIVTDWVSFQLFWRELAGLYVAGTAGGPLAAAPLPELKIQYADFAVWQRRWLSGETLKRYVDYWVEQLAGAPQVLDLPLDRPRPETQTTRGAEQPVELPGRTAEALKALARAEGATPFMGVLAAWKAVLFRLTGQETVLIGSPNANRNKKELEPLLGFFLTQLVFATDGSGDPDFRELVRRVRRSALGAYAHQDLPFGKLLDALKPERDNSRPPLVQANFLLLDAEYTTLELPGLRITPLAVDDGNSRFDMTLGLWDSPARIHGLLEYNRDLFDRSTVQRLAESFAAVVEHAVAAPGARLSELPLLSAAARHQALVEWNGWKDAAALATVPATLARRAAAAPEAPAVLCGGERLSHGELARRAERLARRLAAAGIVRGDRVGLAIERSVDLAVGLLGIWRAGAVYVPLDPSLPRERLAFLAEDAQAAAIVTREACRAALPVGPRLLLLERDAAPGGEDEPAVDLPDLQATALDDPAYLIYTSGTTGRPKGVEVAHRSLAAVLGGIGREAGWGADDRMLSVAPYSFDIFLFELLSPLLAGGSCELLAAVSPLDLDGLLRGLAAATRFHAVPALMRQVAAALRVTGGAPRGLRTLFVGGEAVPTALAAELAALFPAAEVRVLYGPTEGTILAASEPWRGEAQPRLGTALGRPLPGAALRVYDATGGLAALGAAGELFLGGAGVARGYVRRPELTAERFVARDGARWYRTGDRARWLPDGRLEFLGRVDDQVKVRGFRIEPGEVEAALLHHPEVGAAAVVARASGIGAMGGMGDVGDRQLVAYVVPRDGVVPEPDELRAHLRDRLPEYMVPTAFVPLAALPLTAHGKLDKRALPAPAGRRAAGGEARARTREEEILAEVWCGVLGLDEVGLHDNFFQLGGDSILSIQVVARARRAGLVVTPKQLFENQTVAGLAAAVAAAPAAAASVDAEQGLVEGDVPLTPVQRAFFAGRPEPARFNQALLLEIAAPLDPRLLPAALFRVALHHDALRLRFVREPGGWRQLHAPLAPGANSGAAGLAPLVAVDLAALPAARRREALEAAAEALQGALDLARGPLFLAALMTGGRSTGEAGWRDRLLLTAHHLIVDGVSWRVILEDLATAWRQLAAGEAVELPAKTTSWKRWAERLAERARSPEAAAELAHWGALPAGGWVELPRAPGGEGLAGPAATVSIELTEETTRALLREAPEAYRTRVDDLLLTALARALSAGDAAGRRRVLVELEGHGREDLFDGVDLSRTVGWFTAVYPVVLDLPEGGLGAAIRAVKERLRAVPGHGIGYGLLRYLGAGRGAARRAARPPAEVSFNYLGQLDGALNGPFAAAAEEVRGVEDSTAPRRHLLEIDAMVLGGRLRAGFRHGAVFDGAAVDGASVSGAAVERLAERFAAELAAIVEHCHAPEAGGATAADFPLADPAAVEDLARSGRDLREVEDLYPLSPMQEGMLFHAVYAPGSELYFEQLACTLDGPLDAAAFTRAWQRAVDRHPALRATFLWRDGRAPLQAVARRVKLPVLFADWRGEAPAGLAGRWEELLRADRRRGFDLGRAPLLRLALVRTGEREHRLLWSFHHLLFDGWCFTPLFAEVFALYEALRRGSGAEPDLPAPRPYRDYIAWLGRRDAAGSEAFWRGELAGFAAATPLPFDRAEGRSAGALGVRAEDYGERALDLPAAVAAGVERLAQTLQVTASTVLQAAWALLLGRYAGRREALFGAVVSGRPAELPGVESMIGLFINAVPVRLALPREPLAGWLPRVQERQLALRLHEWTPLGRIHAASEIPAGEPLFESLMAFENYPFDAALAERLGELSVRDLAVSERTNYALTLTAVARQGLALRLAHDRRFDGVTAERILGHLAVLLAAMAADPERPAAALPILSPAERHQLAREWNPPAPLPAALPLPARLAARAAVRPEAVAVVHGGEALTYGELARRAHRLAHHLIAAGVRPGDLVALCLERSLALPVAILGALAAGAAYLPLDPAYPAERSAWMLADSGVGALVTEGAALPALPPAGRPLEIIRLDAEAAAIARRPESPPPVALDAEQAAYVIYTSGSTGRPKGVVVSHASVDRLLAAGDPWLAAGPADVWTLFHSYAFDFSVWEMWGALVAGGRLVVVPYGVSRSPEAFLRLLGEERITVLNQTPSAFRQLLWAEETEGGAADLALRAVLFGGEALAPASLAPWIARHGDERPRLANLYGITETTVHVTCRRLGRADLGRGSVVGRPLAGMTVHLLDGDLELLPVGVAGEIYVGGSGLALGYLARPELTAERFLPDPFGPPGARLYRSGDLARRLPDGDLEHLGRADRQVKIRGFRIEPAEVEAALLAHPAVAAAAVVEGEGERAGRLIAYATLRPGATVSTVHENELAAFLAARLPSHMVPAGLVLLDALPLTVHGKLDRAALPEPADARAAAGSKTEPPGEAMAAPATAAEELLAAIWRQVLGRERIGRDDSFFRLGGDSILSLQVVSRARAAGLAITPAQIFERETLAAVAAAAVPLAAAEADQGPVVGAVPLTPIQTWFLDRAGEPGGEPHHFNQSLLLAPAPGSASLSSRALAGAVAALVAHHDALRLRFLPAVDGWRSEIAPPGGPAPYREIDLRSLPAALRTAALAGAAAELQGSFDLARGGLFRAVRFRLGEGADGSRSDETDDRNRSGEAGDRLLLLAHHLVVDGVSWRVLLEDLEIAYDAVAAGRAPELPAKSTSWKRWAEALALRARSSETQAEMPYWLAAASSPAVPLPGERSAGAGRATDVRHVEVGLDAEATEALLGPASVPYRTRVDDLLLAALARALGEGAAGLRVRLDLEGHGREPIAADLDLSRTVGWFTALYPVALALPAGGQVDDAIVAVKEQLREVPGRGLGYGLLSRLSAGAEAARLAALPAPALAFNYLGQLDASFGSSSRWRLAAEPTGPGESPRARPRHAVEVNAWVLDGRLRAAWACDASRVDPAAVERLAHRFAAELAAVVACCLSPEAGAFTPSDFPLAGLDQAAVDRLLGRGGRGASRDRAVEDAYPLSPLQEGMLAESLRAPGAALYYEQLSCALEGDLDAGAFARAWQAVVDRHTALRSEFVWQGLPRPLQVVRRATVPWTREDWRAEPAAQAAPAVSIDDRLAAWLAADRARGFDLAHAPLQRAALFRVGEREHRFVWSFHHLLLDGWCLALVFREVFAAYQAIAAGGAPQLLPARPYRDLVAWLARRDPAAAEAYFRRALAGFTAATPLPLDRPSAPPPAAAAPPEWRERPLPAALARSLEELARLRGLTLNTLVQGAWALLLARLGGVDDVVFGTVVAGRPAELPGVESIVGLFINTLPARARIEPAAPLAAWLRRLQEGQVELRRHEHTPLAAIQRWSDLAPGEPLFASFVAFENYPVDAALAADLASPGLAVRDVAFADRTGFPLSLAALPGRGRGELTLRLAHDHRADGATVLRLLGRMEALLAGFVAAPEAPLAELPWLLAGEEGEIRSVAVAAGSAADLTSAEGPPVAPRTPAERALAEIWSDLLGGGEPSVQASFFRLGGDSILALQAVVRARAAGLVITPAQVFELQTIAALAEAALPVAPSALDAADSAMLSPTLLAELPHWLAVAAAPELRLPRARGGERYAVEPAVIAFAPPVQPLAETAAAYGMGLGELALAALAQALQPESAGAAVRFDLGMDRSGEPSSAAVADLFPALLALPAAAGPGEALIAVKEQLRSIPAQGCGYGRGYGRLRRSGLPEAAPLGELPGADVAFRWWGERDGAPGGDGARALAVDAWTAGGRLHAEWRCRAELERGAIEGRAHRFAGALAGLAAHGASPAAGAYTPSDFPLARLDQAALDGLFGRGAARERGVEDVYPLAPLQEGMLVEALRAPGAGLYFEHLACTLVGDLDVAAFERAWQAVLDRHAALRTAFLWDGLARPLQVVRRGVEIPWTREDWRDLSAAEQEERLAAWLAADRARGFDLASAPLQRAALLRLGEREHRFVWSFHHLLLDGWCLALVFHDLFALYDEARGGRPAELPPPRPYRDLLAWLDARDPREAESFFRGALAGFAAPTRLPLDRPAAPPPAAAEPPRDRGAALGPEVAAGLGRLARQRGLTTNTLVQGAWALALARAAAEDDVVFGAVVAGRPPEIAGVGSIVGLFINTLPVRAVVDPAAPVAAWLARLQEAQVAMRRHEHASLSDVQRWSDVPPGEPLFASLVAFERFPLDGAAAERPVGIEIRDVDFADRTELPLSLAAIPREGDGSAELELRIAHDHRADGATVERLLRQLATLLAGFAAVPERPLRDLPWLAEAEAHQLVREWNDTGEAPADLCLHELVAAQARATPEATAVAGGGVELTYAELAAEAARLARRLRAAGAGPEVPVGLWCERSAAMVAAVLGILEAGAAYVPIDPGEPAERLARILGEAQSAAPARLLVATSSLLARLPGGRPPAGVEAVLLDRPLDDEPEEGVAERRTARPENLAYVLYTSGSTGAPKGVAVEHRSAVAYLRAIVERYGFAPGARALQFASLAFDASVEEIFVALASGATLFVRTEIDEPVRFLARCREQRLTHLSLPTAYWHQLAAALGSEGEETELPPELRLVVLGGERALPEVWDRWSDLAAASAAASATASATASERRVRLVNAYGPTEATISATLHEHAGRAEPRFAAAGREVPIGRPLPGVRAFSLDRDLRPVAIGAVGDLCVAGAGVARGYLGRPEATAAAFVPDPFGPPGARLYRTGDRALSLADGGLEFAGRADAQVKVRGFRIELGEIEGALAAHPGVRESAVVAPAAPTSDAAGGRRLVAFVVPREAGDPAALPADLAGFLAARLPGYMIPELAAVAALPLTPGGKVDRRALLAAAGRRAQQDRQVVAPRNAVEERLADLWREILGVERVSVDDDFFALGGHSLAATRLASRLRSELGVEMPLGRLFELRRLADLARAILDERLGSPDPELADMMEEIDGLSDEEALGLLERMAGEPGDGAHGGEEAPQP